MKYLYLKVLIINILIFSNAVLSQQVNVPRVDLMPNKPSPYEMRDWKKVAADYDSMVFDFNLSGQYVPLIFWRQQAINYPSHNSFGLHTVVGTPHLQSGEAINVMPAVIGASLVGIDKSNQNGQNWVLMCEEFFNRRPAENVYLNHPSASSGSDWWYDTMPNIFFYQLYDLYPGTGDFEYQFTSVADQWLKAVKVMGGRTKPWHMPLMDYRAFSLSTMTPNPNGVHEPEAAGAIGWILYQAYIKTGNENYRIGAEWCIEYLNSLNSNPAYELQLPYGAYIAARMNAELYTSYNINKILNWCFNVGSLRQWGVIVGNWGGYDCYGLVGEALGDGEYAFLMNVFEQVGALVPLVRYDNRYARAIGKWVLNAANASRLFYTNYLPDQNQDSEWWSHQYDTTSLIAHEAMRREWQGYSPYATGDAIAGGWGATNLTLYGSSHVGIFGGIIDTTNIESILKLDLLKTDYFHEQAYPSYLIYNPYDHDTTIVFELPGTENYDIYDAAQNTFLKTNVNMQTDLSISGDQAVVAVLTPAGGSVSYDLDRILVNNIIVDYSSELFSGNYPPRIKSLAADSMKIIQNSSINLYCTAEDKNGDTLIYSWHADDGMITGSGKTVGFTAPDSTGFVLIRSFVSDTENSTDSATIQIQIVESINFNPDISSLTASERKIDLNAQTRLICAATDANGDSLIYVWSAVAGTIQDSANTAIWTAPGIPGNYSISCRAEDGNGGTDQKEIVIMVRDIDNMPTGNLVAYYPFSGNANDYSGNGYHGTVYGAQLTNDRFGNANKAYNFDGVNDYIIITNHDSLNFSQSISVNFWMRIDKYFDREAYPISHGNWENRWKVSLTSQSVRWTIKTTTGIKDLDSENPLNLNEFYNICVTYDGSDFEIYVNGKLNAFSDFSGDILSTTYDICIGQHLPHQNNYNFKGVLDEIRIYDYMLKPQEIMDIYQQPTGINDKNIDHFTFQLFQNYPNPFNSTSRISFTVREKSDVEILLFNTIGQKVMTVLNDNRAAGYHEVMLNGEALPSGVYFCMFRAGHFKQTKKILVIK